MGVILHIIRKEFLQIFKDRPMLTVIFIIPLLQMFILSYAITTDIRNVSMVIQDDDRTPKSRELIASVIQSGRFIVRAYSDSMQNSRNAVFRGDAVISLIIPSGFAKKLHTADPAEVHLLVDGVDSNTALVAAGYARRIIMNHFSRVLDLPLPNHINVKAFYNPELESAFTIVPGIIALLLTIITSLLTALGLVREREIGTLEQLNVTPIRPWQLILGKILPFVILGGAVFALSIGVAMVWFKIPMVGSVGTLAVITGVYLLTTLGLGVFVSTASSTQQQAVFLAWFILVMSILMAGFMFPIANMPPMLQRLTRIIPLRYFIEALRGILLKGATLAELKPQLVPLLILGIIIFGLSVINFRKRV
jgi:ABC-2 type transport system permease protein